MMEWILGILLIGFFWMFRAMHTISKQVSSCEVRLIQMADALAKTTSGVDVLVMRTRELEKRKLP